MKLFQGIRKRFGNYILHNRMKETVRFKEFNNFDTAKEVGVIFNATKLDAFYMARDFIAQVRKNGVRTQGMGYALSKEAASFFEQNEKTFESEIDVFSKGNVNWYYKPNNPLTDAFCNKDFDILIDLSVGHDLPLNFIVGLSKAKLKIGSAESSNPYYDMTIDTSANPSLEYYLKQIENYLGAMGKL